MGALQYAITNNFETYMPGYISSQALLHAVETRTSSPVRVCRDSNTLQAFGDIQGLYPCGEGAGYAGGIVSAAVDGLMVYNAIMKEYNILHQNDFKFDKQISANY